MRDDVNALVHTAQTLFVVLCVYVGRRARIAESGDVAPVVLRLLGPTQPVALTGLSLKFE